MMTLLKTEIIYNLFYTFPRSMSIVGMHKTLTTHTGSDTIILLNQELRLYSTKIVHVLRSQIFRQIG